MKKLKEEFFKILPPTIFFFVALHLVMFIHVLMLKGVAVNTSSSISIAVAALILGKAVLIADMVPMINRFPHKPLIYNVAWKTLIYWLMATLIHYLERLIDFWRQAGGLVAGNRKLLAEIIWPHFWASRSFCSSSSPRIARCTSWCALSGKKKCCGYSSDRCLRQHFERG
jgi:hypothetical protein